MNAIDRWLDRRLDSVREHEEILAQIARRTADASPSARGTRMTPGSSGGAPDGVHPLGRERKFHNAPR
ncbi:MAG: hypothetical protein ACYDDF_12690 [Thermoplasmatota archaeon]